MTDSLPILFEIEPGLSVDEFVEVLQRSTLDQRRPVDRPDQILAMLRNAQLIVTARQVDSQSSRPGKLIGVSRAITDFAYCTYLSDLAVDQAFQGQGIGKRLVHLTHQKAGLHTRLILLAAPAAQSYYPHIGMEPHHSCWQTAPANSYPSSPPQ